MVAICLWLKWVARFHFIVILGAVLRYASELDTQRIGRHVEHEEHEEHVEPEGAGLRADCFLRGFEVLPATFEEDGSMHSWEGGRIRTIGVMF